MATSQPIKFTHACWLVHSLRTAVAATISFSAARALGMPEAYWASISSIIVMQSTLGAAWLVSKHRLIGTFLGTLLGSVVASYFGVHILAFGLGLFLLGQICAALDLDQSAYRFAGVAFAIVVLVSRKQAPWIIALHRFVEVSLGIAVALFAAVLLPERPPVELPCVEGPRKLEPSHHGA